MPLVLCQHSLKMRHIETFVILLALHSSVLDWVSSESQDVTQSVLDSNVSSKGQGSLLSLRLDTCVLSSSGICLMSCIITSSSSLELWDEKVSHSALI